MLIRSGIARIVAAVVAAVSAVVAAFLLLYRVPIWFIGLSGPWEYRSTSNHFVADAIAVAFIVLGLVMLPALTRIFYLAWSPRPTVGTPSTMHSVDGGTPNISLERTLER
jgi:hypothetical protein